MNLKDVIWWFGLGLLVWLAASLLSGFVFGIVKVEASSSIFLRAFGGMVVPLLFFVRYFLIIAGALLATILLWALVVRRFPVLESSRLHQVISLVIYALILGIIVFLLFPFERSLAFFAASFTILSILIPRFLIKKLSPGSFAA